MKLVADENLSRDVVQWLRSLGHDVLAIREAYPQLPDIDIAQIAIAEHRLVITRDMDFGEIVFAQELVLPGVLLLRLSDLRKDVALERLRTAWPLIAERLEGSFIVLSEDKLRIRKLE